MTPRRLSRSDRGAQAGTWWSDSLPPTDLEGSLASMTRSMRARRTPFAFVLSFLVLAACTQGGGETERSSGTGPSVPAPSAGSGAAARGRIEQAVCPVSDLLLSRTWRGDPRTGKGDIWSAPFRPEEASCRASSRSYDPRAVPFIRRSPQKAYGLWTSRWCSPCSSLRNAGLYPPGHDVSATFPPGGGGPPAARLRIGTATARTW